MFTRGLALAALACLAGVPTARAGERLEQAVVGTWMQVDPVSDHLVIEFRADHTMRAVSSCGHLAADQMGPVPWRIGPSGLVQFGAGQDGPVQFVDSGIAVADGKLSWQVVDGAIMHFEPHPHGTPPPCAKPTLSSQRLPLTSANTTAVTASTHTITAPDGRSISADSASPSA